MKRCIFCGSINNTYKCKEHIIPNSLGGKDILPDGLVCDNCNNYFGRKFEIVTLNFEDMKFIRALERIPNYKGRTPVANAKKVIINLDEKPFKTHFSPLMKKTMYRKVSAHFEFPPSKLGPFLRLLLKIGLEYFAKEEQADDIFEPKFNRAKEVVRCPSHGLKWPLAIKKISNGSSELYSHKFHRNHENNSVIFEFSYWLTCYLIPLDDNDFEKFQLEIGDSEYNVRNVGIL